MASGVCSFGRRNRTTGDDDVAHALIATSRFHFTGSEVFDRRLRAQQWWGHGRVGVVERLLDLVNGAERRGRHEPDHDLRPAAQIHQAQVAETEGSTEAREFD